MRGVLRVAPAGFVRRDVGLGALLERHRLCRGKLRLLTRFPALLDRVDAVEPSLAAGERFLACFGKADGVDGSQSHHPEPARLLEPKYPALGAARADLQEQPAAVAVQARAPLPGALEWL